VTDISQIDTCVKVGKASAALNHLRQNRIEYLVLLVFTHMLGLTDLVVSKTSGVCGL
jgi:hypothetical protein